MSKQSADFVHLHVHSEYSLLDGACRIPDLVKAAKKNQMPAVALTDHGNMYGAIQFYSECAKAGVKPLIGTECYIAPASRLDKESKGIQEASFHLILLAKNQTGYQNLIKLNSIANLEGFYYKPRIDKEILAQHAEGLVCLSSCLQGEVSYLLARDEQGKAQTAAGQLAEIFPEGDFYLEIQDHGIPEQQKIIKPMLELGKKLKLPVVATNDLHYLEQSDAQAHDALLCIQTQANLEDSKRFRFDGDQFYFKSPEEMKKIFSETKEAVLRTREVADKCNLQLEFDKIHLPQFEPPKGKDQKGYLKELVQEGVSRRYGQVSSEVKNRVEKELEIISKTGFTSYFLVIWDVVHHAKSEGISVGPGRGSAAGSVVSYCLGITDLDPIQHGLIFERFLNPDRISMPDIDIDFCYERRSEIIEYVSQKYGENNVAHVITFGTMQAKAAVRDVARVMGFTYPEADRIAKLIPFELGMTLKKALEASPELKNLYQTDPRVTQLIDTSSSLEGMVRHASTHAAGVVIADGDLTEHVPLIRSSDGQITTGYEMGGLEKIGLLKMDFLGLRTLTVIDETEKLIQANHQKDFSIGEIPIDDAKTYQMLTQGDATAVFQLESSGMRDLMRRLKPERFDDLVALVALFRPGPLGSGMVDDFIHRRHGKIQVRYDHPSLEPLLKDTYGTILFQEQVMQIANVLAGFSMAQADGLRRAMGKKTAAIMEQAKEEFVNGCVKNKVDRALAQQIFEKIEYFAGYAFNRSHSAAYALIAYRTAFLKANYPVEFMTALLTSERDNTDKIAQYVEESRRMKIEILPPDVNKSFSRFTVEGQAIRYGLSGIKNVGEKAIESITQTREQKGPFSSLMELCERVDSRLCNRKVLESLIKCGAFDSLKLHRSQLIAQLEQSMMQGAKRQKEKSGGQLSFFDVFGSGETQVAQEAGPVPDLEEWPKEQLLAFEKSLLGFYLTGHPLDNYRDLLKMVSSCSTAGLGRLRDGEEVTLGGVVSRIKLTNTKRGNERMAILGFEDFEGTVEALVFPKLFPSVEANLKPDLVVLLTARVSLREDAPKLLTEDIVPLEEGWSRRVQGIEIRIDPDIQRNTLEALKKALTTHPGKLPVELAIANGGNGSVHVAVGSTLNINPTLELLQTLVDLVGAEAIAVKSR